jgi:hypothetical protein
MIQRGHSECPNLAYAGGDRKALAEPPWYLNIYFSDRGVVESVDTNPPPNAELKVSA